MYGARGRGVRSRYGAGYRDVDVVSGVARPAQILALRPAPIAVNWLGQCAPAGNPPLAPAGNPLGGPAARRGQPPRQESGRRLARRRTSTNPARPATAAAQTEGGGSQRAPSPGAITGEWVSICGAKNE